jgi:two-component system osmolarity sensor histidine kinase EnvZ
MTTRARAVDGPRHAQRLWVRYPNSPNWIVTPVDLPPAPPILIESVGMLLAAVILSLVAAWQLQRPLSRVAQGARQFGAGERPVPVDERGPRELRDLIRAFNQMMRRINDADDEKAVMLAGIAHDLKAPLTRLKLRASVLVQDDAERAHFIGDIDSLTRIVQQFLEFAANVPTSGPAINVDDFLAEQFAQDEAGDTPLFRLDLGAGNAFQLPRTLLDRLVTNLVDNALEHGAPPVDISTGKRNGEWFITVRDYGDGIPPERLDEAVCPPRSGARGRWSLRIGTRHRRTPRARTWRPLRYRQRGRRRPQCADCHSNGRIHPRGLRRGFTYRRRARSRYSFLNTACSSSSKLNGFGSSVAPLSSSPSSAARLVP